MKQTKALVSVLLLSLAGCGGDEKAAATQAPAAVAAPAPPTPTATPTPAAAPAVAPVSAPASLAILKNYLDAWNQHDADRAGSFLADDVTYFDPSFAGLQRGRQAAVEQGISVFMRGVPDLHWEIRSDPILSADGIAYEWTFTGSNTATWGGIPATNQKINLKGMSFVRISNGKISYQATYYDGSTLNRQLGL